MQNWMFYAASCRAFWLTGATLWLGGIAMGLAVLAWHEGTPGAPTDSPRQWPEKSKIPLNDQGNTLVMFVHPRCPCTRASLSELEKIIAGHINDMNTWVVFFQPADTDLDWMKTDQVATAQSLFGVRVLCDLHGEEAQRFHAITSGHTLLYNDTGELQFSGGITFARGHAGDNAGRKTIEMALTGRTPAENTSPVFGCSLLECCKQEQAQ